MDATTNRNLVSEELSGHMLTFIVSALKSVQDLKRLPSQENVIDILEYLNNKRLCLSLKVQCQIYTVHSQAIVL